MNEVAHGRPKGGYFIDGERVPSVTTILSRFKESGGLIHWAWTLGTEGKDYREERDSAADAGTLAHQLVDDWIHGKLSEPLFPPNSDTESKAQQAFFAFREWADQSELKVTQTEVPLVSNLHKFGGTLDAIMVKGKRAIGDWKTSNAIYPEYLIQLAAYRGLWNENFPDQPTEGGYHLIRFDKQFGDFHHHWWPELDRAWTAFLLMRELYDIMKELKQRAK